MVVEPGVLEYDPAVLARLHDELMDGKKFPRKLNRQELIDLINMLRRTRRPKFSARFTAILIWLVEVHYRLKSDSYIQNGIGIQSGLLCEAIVDLARCSSELALVETDVAKAREAVFSSDYGVRAKLRTLGPGEGLIIPDLSECERIRMVCEMGAMLERLSGACKRRIGRLLLTAGREKSAVDDLLARCEQHVYTAGLLPAGI